MQDLIVLELIISAVLFLAIVRPFVKGFRGIEGIAALPALALIASIAVFPAYGVRPEFFPLFALAFIMFLGSIPRLADVVRRLRTDDYGERSILRLAFGILALSATTVFAIAYAPKTERAADAGSTADRDAILYDEMRDVTLYVRLYGEAAEPDAPETERPVLLVAPPLAGSLAMVDSLCGTLSERGFLVAAFSRVGLDFPAALSGEKVAYPGIENLFRSAVGFVFGTRYVYAARSGSIVELERSKDFAFLASYIRAAAERRDALFSGADPDRMIVAGFGSGGAAAAIYAASPPPFVVAAVSVEGPILSALGSAAAPGIAIPDEASRGPMVWVERLFSDFRGGTVAGIGTVPSTAVPTLFLVSDLVREPKERDGRYATIIRALRTSKAPCVLASLAGAGPFEFTDAGSTFPVYAAFMPGAGERSRGSGYYVDASAALIGNFLHTVIAVPGETGALGRMPIDGEFQLESNRSWTSMGLGDILRQ